jgi:hypothetical protein
MGSEERCFVVGERLREAEIGKAGRKAAAQFGYSNPAIGGKAVIRRIKITKCRMGNS